MCSCSGGNITSATEEMKLINACESLVCKENEDGYKCKYPLKVICCLISSALEAHTLGLSTLTQLDTVILGLRYQEFLSAGSDDEHLTRQTILHLYFLKMLGINYGELCFELESSFGLK